MASPTSRWRRLHIDRRVEQMQAEGVVFRTGVLVGAWPAEAPAARSPTTPPRPIRAEQTESRLRRRAAERWRRDLARPAGARPRTRRRALRDGIPAAAEQGGGRRQGQGPDQGHRQARHRHRRRRHRQRLRRHQQPPRRRQRDAVRTDAAAARRGGPAADLALLALQAAHQFQPRGRLPARVRHRHQGVRRRHRQGQGQGQRR